MACHTAHNEHPWTITPFLRPPACEIIVRMKRIEVSRRAAYLTSCTFWMGPLTSGASRRHPHLLEITFLVHGILLLSFDKQGARPGPSRSSGCVNDFTEIMSIFDPDLLVFSSIFVTGRAVITSPGRCLIVLVLLLAVKHHEEVDLQFVDHQGMPRSTAWVPSGRSGARTIPVSRFPRSPPCRGKSDWCPRWRARTPEFCRAQSPT